MQTASKKIVNGWAMYDWANSVYNLVITTTFFPAYYAAVTGIKNFPDGITFLGRTFVNTELKDYVLAFGFLLIALLSPILSSIADYKGNKKNFMRFFCYLGAISCSTMFFFDKDHVTLGLVCFMFAGIGFYGSQVFYNSYLPEIAAEEDMDRISAKGFTMGYIGSVLLQMVGFALVVVMKENPALPLKITFLLVGVWWVVFAQIPFSRLPNQSNKTERKLKKHVLVNGFHELRLVWKQVANMPVLKRFLTAFFFYSMGVQTVLLVAIDFGIKVLNLENVKLIITAVLLQLVAILGALLMSRLSGRFGNIQVLIFTVLLWICACVGGYYIQTEMHFYIVASFVGLVMGGIQALSRATYAKLMPATKDTTSFFSFYDVTEKFAIVIGLFSFGFIEGITKNMRNSILVLIIFFVLGLVFLWHTLRTQRKEQTALS
ncbi:MFS transporter [Lacibacter luteus]|uniref:MFS transporter n=1 Tax=Lacibacter luteus TaxID=2508719 RepID=A0A4Q1CI65_9BACT|nr:MFS transporter [Lacibacter luteus]RXK59990.1 MFS transporter [Lacibacter luteus]